MSHTLVSFLGRGPYSQEGVRRGYQSVRYQFSDVGGNTGWTSQPSKHFAYAAYEFHQQLGQTPLDSVVILGTSGSMWDALADSFGTLGKESVSEVVLELSDLVDQQVVTQEVLDIYSAELTEMTATSIRLLLIPAANDSASQATILEQITQAIADGDRVYLDVTHGYRHLPMIGLAAAAVAATSKRAQIEDIVYGALDMTRDGHTPVVSLVWILQLFNVLNGLNTFSRRQNLRPLIDCFPGGKVRTALEEAAFKLDVMRIDEAAAAVRDCLKTLAESVETLPIELQLVAGVVRGRLEQFSRQKRNIKGLTQMASLALDEDDFLRTAIYLSEAVQKAAKQGIPGDTGEDRKLSMVRNWLAHAGKLTLSKDDREVRDWISNRNQLRAFFRKHIERLQEDVRPA